MTLNFKTNKFKSDLNEQGLNIATCGQAYLAAQYRFRAWSRFRRIDKVLFWKILTSPEKQVCILTHEATPSILT